jgi:hypothetical protein
MPGMRSLSLGVASLLLALVCIVAGSSFLLKDLVPQPQPLQYARWLLNSAKYKREVLAQVGSATDLKHIEWDGWGWGGSDTVIYLVFDPDDALNRAASSGAAGKYPGLPCEVYRVRRLESQWYTIHFYTDADWNHCQ